MPVALLLCAGDRDGAAHGSCWPRSTSQALDIGGGFPGPYHGNDVPPYHWYFDTIKEALDTLPKQVPVLCEPGRALIAEGLSLITQVCSAQGRQALHQ